MSLHLLETHTGEEARRQAALLPPFGPGLAAELIEPITRIEVWGTTFDHPGTDFCEFRAFDESGHLIATRTVEGF